MKRIIALLTYLLFTVSTIAQTHQKVYYYEIDDVIAKPALKRTQLALDDAKEQNTNLILLRLNTFGGELEAADQIRTLLMKSEIPVYVFIDVNAASAGALISIACDSIYMAPGASIGAASVVDQEGTVLPDKYQSYMRSLMRSTAEKKGRDPDIAQAMVDPDVYIEGIIDSNKVLTFTTSEAIIHGFCEGEVNSREEVMKINNITDYQFVEQELSWIDRFTLFLINPIVSGLLIMAIIGGIYFELQTPGVGFPLIVAIIAALLFFAPHYINGLAAHWEILLFVIGLILLLVEIFVIPGFGIVGISGIVLMVVSLVLAMIFNIKFNFQFTPPSTIFQSIMIVVVALAAGFGLSIWLGKKLILARTPFGTIALNTEMLKEEGYLSQNVQWHQLVGKEGISVTILRPAGKIEIDGIQYDAVAKRGIIERETQVKVIGFENSQLVVVPQ